ncbi:hypothetical protein Tco_0389991 [Tanacetum coccineum]
MKNSKKGYTPMMKKPDYKKSQGAKTPSKVQCMQRVPYASAIGSIIRFQQNPSEIHWTVVKTILKYLRNNKDMVLVYRAKPEAELKVSCYADASFQTDKDDTKSQTLYVFVLNGGAIEWKSAKQSTTAMSSIEVEYIAAAEASMEAVWMKKFIDGLGDVVPSNKRPMEMLCDNEPAIAIATDPGILSGAIHFQRKYHYIREVIQEREIVLKKVHTDDNVADLFTKLMSFNKHFEHAMAIGIVPEYGRRVKKYERFQVDVKRKLIEDKVRREKVFEVDEAFDIENSRASSFQMRGIHIDETMVNALRGEFILLDSYLFKDNRLCIPKTSLRSQLIKEGCWSFREEMCRVLRRKGLLSNSKLQIFVTKDCDDGSRPEEQHLVVPCSDEKIVKCPTQPATTKISGEDGSNLEEFSNVLTVKEADITGPIMALEDEPLMMLGPGPNIIKEDFSNDLDGQHSTDEKMICAQRRTWDPGITWLKILKEHLEDKDVNKGKHLRTSSSKERGNDEDMIQELAKEEIDHLERDKSKGPGFIA